MGSELIAHESLMKMLNSSAPNSEPQGTPVLTVLKLEHTPSNLTHCDDPAGKLT